MIATIERARAVWEATIAQLGEVGLDQPGAVGRWRVRDVLAHFNGWDRWQLVQLRSAFTGETPGAAELVGGLDMPEPDPSMPFDDGMNAAFEAANRGRPVDAVVGDWRDLCHVRARWVAAATQNDLDAIVGSDWRGAPGRYVRLQSEVGGVGHPMSAARFVLDQVEHQLGHLTEVQAWMDGLA